LQFNPRFKVRTRAVGHLRDVRRLVVALSRARLGLYVFGRRQVFEGVYELKPALDQLFAKPTDLELVLGERWPLTSRKADNLDKSADALRKGSAEGEAALHTLKANGAVTELGTIVQSMLAIAQPQAQPQAAQEPAEALTEAPTAAAGPDAMVDE